MQHLSLSFFLKTGTTSAIFKESGKTPSKKDLLIKVVIIGANTRWNFFKKCVLMLEEQAFHSSKLAIIIMTSFSVTGFKVKLDSFSGPR